MESYKYLMEVGFFDEDDEEQLDADLNVAVEEVRFLFLFYCCCSDGHLGGPCLFLIFFFMKLNTLRLFALCLIITKEAPSPHALFLTCNI